MTAGPASAAILREALANSPERWVFSPPAVSLRLVLAVPPPGTDPADLVDPFVVLSDRGALSRVLLAELVGPTEMPVMTVALKLQSDEYPLIGDAGAGGPTNVDVEDAWAREIAVLEAAGGRGAGIPAVVEALPRDAGAAARVPPTFYCKRRRAFFPAPCPECGGPLGDVRDGRVLEERGVPRFDASLVRFLGCPECLARGTGRLWTLVRDPRAGGDAVGDLEDLLVALGPLAGEPAGESARLPCQGCDRVPTCFPAGTSRPEVVRNVTPLTFYESRCLATELLHLRYDEFASLLGGTSLAVVAGAITERGRATTLRTLEGRVGEDRCAFFFATDPAGKLGLETLRLKLGLFRQLCLATAALHRHAQVPHLGLDPARAMVRILPARTGLPDLWNFALELLGIGNAIPRRLPVGTPQHLPAASYRRPRLVDPVYAAPVLREAPVEECPGTLTLRGIARATDGLVVVEADLEGEALEASSVGDYDTVDVSVVQGRPPLALTLVGTPVGRSGSAVRLRSIPLALDADVRDQLAQLVDRPFPRARFTVHPCLHVPCDVHALGMMLLASLLANAERSPAAVRRVVDDLVRALDTGGSDPTSRAHALIRAGISDGTLASRHVFARPSDHGPAAEAVPAGLWRDALVLGLRAVTTIRGFSVCRSGSDFDPAHPEVKVEHLVQLLDTLVRQVDAALFGLPGRAGEVRGVLDRVARELNLADG